MSNEEHATGTRPERLERKLAAILHAEVKQEDDNRWSAWIEAFPGSALGEAGTEPYRGSWAVNAACRLSPRVLLILWVLLGVFAWPGEAHAAQLRLTWQDNSSTEAGFLIERRVQGTAQWVQIATRTANVTSYTDTTVSAGTTYCYRVRAFNAVGRSSASQEFCAKPTAEGQPNRARASKSPTGELPTSARSAEAFDPRMRRGRKRVGDGWVQELPPAR